MLQVYRNALQTPGALAFSLAGLVGRLPASMAGLGIVLLVQTTTGSYAQAGIMSAIYILTSAVAAPMQGRIADFYGQRLVLFSASSIFAIGIAVLVGNTATSPGLTALGAVIAGMGAPQTGNMVRTRWTHVAKDAEILSTAFALEAIFDEVVFIIGPVLVTFLTLNVYPPLGLAIAALCAVVGAWSLAAQGATTPVVIRREGATKEPLQYSVLASLIIAAIGLGIVFGSAEILIVAFTDELGQKTLAGWVLAVSSVGSLLAGFAVGARASVASPVNQLRVYTTLLMVSLLPLPLANSTWQIAIGMFVMGLTIAPTLITAVNLVEKATPLSRLTEALTWVTTGLSAGVAGGALISGRVVESFSASLGFVVPALAASITVLVAWFAPVPHSFDQTKNL